MVCTKVLWVSRVDVAADLGLPGFEVGFMKIGDLSETL